MCLRWDSVSPPRVSFGAEGKPADRKNKRGFGVSGLDAVDRQSMEAGNVVQGDSEPPMRLERACASMPGSIRFSCWRSGVPCPTTLFTASYWRLRQVGTDRSDDCFASSFFQPVFDQTVFGSVEFVAHPKLSS